MSKVNTTLEDNAFFRYLVVIGGMIIACIGVNGFLRPAHLLSGGVPGASTAINYLTGINIGLLTFLINIPIFILGFIYLEKEFCISSLINMMIFSFLLGITQDIAQYIPINDILLQSVYGGILSGIGSGIVFRTKSSQGGTDILAAILKFKKNIPMKDTTLSINILIVSIGGVLFGMDLALYTLIGMFISAYCMNFVKDAMNYQKSVMVVSRESNSIAREIMSELHRGVTFLEAEGAYTHEKKKLIYCIVSSNEIPKIKEIALKYDKKSFISVNDVSEVKGRGFKEKYL
ncbi:MULTISPECIES: YitT family protein [Romboutsia]|uniref:YitT family protein n=1 Tax=Romboutsia TaxID=1501226 RepID=UPI00189B8DE4|nr:MULTISPECIES: YitT family protein [Romboutsia]MCH1960729.1 YitT family protein [Romboutsia hominis]MCH1968840.1 YitT family protein [Romboutsia hominis]MDB8804283.1 YitT family protein [Romboutsia sp. 1001216sp1]MDB8807759.1 YitT family protein [Romboutsia sp. 1001216sp1]MDB8809929.1 YitT family protein [Romboutsia sp. 1001216sp1]